MNDSGLVDLLKNGKMQKSPIILEDLLDYHTISNFLGEPKISITLKNSIISILSADTIIKGNSSFSFINKLLRPETDLFYAHKSK